MLAGRRCHNGFLLLVVGGGFQLFSFQLLVRDLHFARSFRIDDNPFVDQFLWAREYPPFPLPHSHPKQIVFSPHHEISAQLHTHTKQLDRYKRVDLPISPRRFPDAVKFLRQTTHLILYRRSAIFRG